MVVKVRQLDVEEVALRLERAARRDDLRHLLQLLHEVLPDADARRVARRVPVLRERRVAQQPVDARRLVQRAAQHPVVRRREDAARLVAHEPLDGVPQHRLLVRVARVCRRLRPLELEDAVGRGQQHRLVG